MEFDELSHRVIGCAIEVHKQLGPGLLESAYEQFLVHEFGLADIPCQRQVSMPVAYKGILLDCGYRIDLLIADTLVVELKCVERVLPIHEAQLLTYMRLAQKRIGLLINFYHVYLKQGV